jgi:hypothetical protein
MEKSGLLGPPGLFVMLNLENLTESDLFGRFHLALKGAVPSVKSYYDSLCALRPLFRSTNWLNAATGWYLNIDDDCRVRLSYFTRTPAATHAAVSDFARRAGFEEPHSDAPPQSDRVSAMYGGEELRFRRYLATYTAIGLELLAADLLHARRLFACFRFCVMPPRLPYRPFFEPTFQRHSSMFGQLQRAAQEQFWLDFANWPDPRQVDWAHMFVNMVLGCDWTEFCRYPPEDAWSLDRVNGVLRDGKHGFQIPEHWTPAPTT